MSLGMIWAQSHGGVIGRDGDLPWPQVDGPHFRAVTAGQPVIMGRRTWESLPERFRPLPGRRNIVVTRQSSYHAPGAEVVGSLDEAGDRVLPGTGWVIGGGQLYADALDRASVAEVTEVDIDVPGDTYAPPLDGWQLESAGDWQSSDRTGLRFRCLRYVRPISSAPG